MREQSAKNNLIDIITGTRKNDPKVFFLNEGDERPDPKTLGPHDSVIIFTDFQRKNESSQETK